MRRAPSAALLLVALSVACGSSQQQPPPSSSGALRVEVTAPAGVAAAVRVTGPAGFDRTLQASATLDLPPGVYAVSAADIRSPGMVVDTLFRGTVSGTADVAAGRTTTVQVAYARQPGTGGLWLAAPGLVQRGLSRFDDAQLRASGAPTSAVALSPGFYPAAVAFDGEGGLWTADASYSSGTLFRLSPAALDHSHSPVPDRTLQAVELPSGTSLSLASVQALAFDRSGHLWVANCAPDYRTGLVRFSPAQLAQSGAPSPTRVLGESLFSCASDLALDAEGGLWAVNHQGGMPGTGRIHGWTAGQLSLTDDVPPEVSLAASGDALRYPTSLAFDASGDLWVANCSTIVNHQLLPATVEKYSRSARAASGPASPEVVLTGFVCPVGLAFDNAGALWVHDADSLSQLYRFLPEQLQQSGAPTPSTSVSAGPTDTGRPVFHPHPSGLPLS